MEVKKVDAFMLESSKYFPADKTMYVKEKLMALDDSRSYTMSTEALKNPTTILVAGVLAGYFGVDRFLAGDIGMGILKLITLGGVGIWWIVDWFVLPKKVRENNFSKFMTLI